MRRLASLSVLLLLAGCALPPALSLASFAADGVSYLATGKSTTDHALSAIAQEDCALLRALKEEAICVPGHKAAVHVIATEPPAERPSHLDDDDAEDEWTRMRGPAFMLVQTDFVARPHPAAALQLVEKNLPAAPAAVGPLQSAKKDRPVPSNWAAISRNTGLVVLSHCAGTGGMQPAAQCGLGPDA